MISVEQLSVEFGATPLFDSVSFLVNPKDKIALVGKNGAGKTTMLKIFAGQQKPTSGRISIPKDLTIGYLPQTMIHSVGTTVVQETEKAFDEIKKTEQYISELTEEISQRTDYAITFMERIVENGYSAMFYAGKNEMEQNAEWEISRMEKAFKVWVAEYTATPYPQTPVSSSTEM